MQYHHCEDSTIFVDIPIADTIKPIIEIYPLPCDNNTFVLNEIELTTGITISNIRNNTFDIESHEIVVQPWCPSDHADMTNIFNILKIKLCVIIIVIITLLLLYFPP